MAGALPPTTPTPVFMTRSRKIRAHNSFDPDDQSIDSIAETGELPDPVFEDALHDEEASDENVGTPDRAYAADRVQLDTTPQTMSAALDPEEPNMADTKLQASGAYQVLRQPDEEDRTPVGTV